MNWMVLHKRLSKPATKVTSKKVIKWKKARARVPLARVKFAIGRQKLRIINNTRDW
jgi:hypothetical protein